MNAYIVIGLLVVLVGSALIAFGTNRKNEKDAEKVEAKVQEVLTRLDNAQAQSADPSVNTQIAAIRSDFSDWATQFASSRSSKRLEREQSLLQREAARISEVLPARTLIASAVEDVRLAVRALSAAGQQGVSANLPTLPSDLARNRWEGTVSFPHDTKWKLTADEMDPGSYLLSIVPSVAGEAPLESRNAFYLTIELRTKPTPYWQTFTDGDYFIPNSKIETEKMSLEGYEQPLKEVIQRLFELQLLILDSHATS